MIALVQLNIFHFNDITTIISIIKIRIIWIGNKHEFNFVLILAHALYAVEWGL